MSLFEYSGYDQGGKRVAGIIEASGRRAAVQKLQGQGIFPAELREEGGPAGAGRFGRWLPPNRRLPAAALAAATRQLATLLGAGLPLDETLAAVGAQPAHPRLARAISQTREEVLQGSSLHEALARHPRIFPELFINMVQVGESSGTLDQVLHRLADFQEEQARILGRVRAAMAYPLLMTVIGTGVLCFLMAFVVPKVTRMLEELSQALPLPTLLLIAVSDFLRANGGLLLAATVLAVLGARRYARTERGRMLLDQKLLTLPLFGRVNLLIATARFTRTLATLLHSGVPLLQALEITRSLLRNRVLNKALADTARAVREGKGLAEPLGRSGVFPPMVIQMAAVGERSGELEGMLFRVAETYERQVEATLAGMLALLEPLLILVMGSAVGFVVLAVLLPIFQASQGLG